MPNKNLFQLIILLTTRYPFFDIGSGIINNMNIYIYRIIRSNPNRMLIKTRYRSGLSEKSENWWCHKHMRYISQIYIQLKSDANINIYLNAYTYLCTVIYDCPLNSLTMVFPSSHKYIHRTHSVRCHRERWHR